VELYLVQHGEAAPTEEDAARPLTATGLENAERAAAIASHLNLNPSVIYQSGKLRAHQTAEIIAEALQPLQWLKKLEGLNPSDDPTIAQQIVEASKTPVMMVGHLPHLSRLASLLVTGAAEPEIVAFQNAALVCLRLDGERWQLKWIVPPLVAGLGV